MKAVLGDLLLCGTWLAFCVFVCFLLTLISGCDPALQRVEAPPGSYTQQHDCTLPPTSFSGADLVMCHEEDDVLCCGYQSVVPREGEEIETICGFMLCRVVCLSEFDLVFAKCETGRREKPTEQSIR